MKRRFFFPLAVVSLLIAVASISGWIDSYWNTTAERFPLTANSYSICAINSGVIVMSVYPHTGQRRFSYLRVANDKIPATLQTPHLFFKVVHTAQVSSVDVPIWTITLLSLVGAGLLWRYRFKRDDRGFDVEVADVIARSDT